ncbi:MAG: RelA/SpoT family protein [Bacteroidales bacterium]|nr:RelA/SpoT family protein [Bacteroidales bacterium]
MVKLEEKRIIRAKYLELLRLCSPFIKKDDIKLIRSAFELTLKAHSDDWEKTGEEYIYHSIEVARIATKEIGLGTTSVICALLHNVVDEKNITFQDIEQNFGKSVISILKGFNKISGLQTEKISLHSDNFRKLYLTLVDDIRVILIKLAHRLYNMRNFDLLPEKKQHKFLSEVTHLYIPIVHRLGLYNIKSELEELSMKHTNPEIYNTISHKIQATKSKRNVFIQEFINPIQRELIRQGFDCEIIGRPKSIHSIWTKMKKQNVKFEEVYDLFAIRIICNTNKKNEKADCWRIYSIVSDIFKPNPKRLRDWISNPKASGYESLHTTLLGSNGKWVEVQIRSKRMDEIAEKGLAAHWKYKESGGKKDKEEWMNKLRNILENPEHKAIEKTKNSKLELYSDKIFIFTPEGDLKKLSKGSTVLDFAYEIHTKIGSMCSGAKVNNKNVPIRHLLKNGDKVEIITSKKQKPKLDWLQFVITSKAKSKIKRSIKEEKYKEAEIGKDILKRKLRNRKIQFKDENIDKLVKHYKLKSSVDLYYLFAIEKIDLSDIKKLLEETPTKKDPDKSINIEPETTSELPLNRKDEFMLIDNNIDNLDYELAKCCNPISGDDVFGFVAIGKGITIHRINCPNATQMLSKYKYRVINVKWRQTKEKSSYHTIIRITGKDEIGILNNITRVISNDLKVNMVSISVGSNKNNKFEGNFKVNVFDTNHLEMLLHKLSKIKGVKKATRVNY